MAEIAKRIEERPFSVLDINMGCPVPKVVNNKEGSALMKNPQLARKIMAAVAKAVKKPVTVKIRKGFDDEHINAVELARIAPIIMPSQPVSSSNAFALSGSFTSPLPITGMETASFTCLIMSQSALPL